MTVLENRALIAAAAVFSGTLVGCVDVRPFQCEFDSQCSLGDVTGSCEKELPNAQFGDCAFPDASCGPNGFRLDSTAATPSAGECFSKTDTFKSQNGEDAPPSDMVVAGNNGCGGTTELPFAPDGVCGPCDLGRYRCGSVNSVVCDHNYVATELLEEDFEKVQVERCSRDSSGKALIDGRLSTVCWTNSVDEDPSPTFSDFDFKLRREECVLEAHIYGNAGFAMGQEANYDDKEISLKRSYRGFSSLSVQALGLGNLLITSVAGLKFPSGLEPLRVRFPNNDFTGKQIDGGVMTEHIRLRGGPHISDDGGGIAELRVFVARPREIEVN